jgi:SAM-dependent methyltransferase
MKINVGCGRNILPGWVNIDRITHPEVLCADLNECATIPLPLPSDSADEILLSHVIEHIPNALPLMQELHRIAMPGAKVTIRVPYGSSDDAWEDPTHVRAYFPGSFGYFSQPYFWRADYGFRGDFRPLTITLFTVDGQSTLQRINAERNVVTEMVAVLEAVKPIREARKELQTAPQIILR